MPASPIRKLMPLADEAKRRGVHVYHLNIGQPDLETPAAMRARLATLERQGLRLLAVGRHAGVPRLAARLLPPARHRARADELIATTGGSEALLFAFFACADEGDEVLVVEPYYTNYNSFAAMAGVRLVPLPTRGRGRLPPAAARGLGAGARRRARGSSCSATRTTRPARSTPRRARDGGRVLPRPRLFLVSDEVYREFVYDGPRAASRAHARRASRSRSSSSTASRSATAPAASGWAASPRATARSTRRRCAWRRGASRRRASRSSSPSA